MYPGQIHCGCGQPFLTGRFSFYRLGLPLIQFWSPVSRTGPIENDPCEGKESREAGRRGGKKEGLRVSSFLPAFLPALVARHTAQSWPQLAVDTFHRQMLVDTYPRFTCQERCTLRIKTGLSPDPPPACHLGTLGLR